MVIKCGESLAGYTTFRIGGTGDVMVAESADEVSAALRSAPVVIGNGSNLLIAEKKWERPFLKAGGGLNSIEFDGGLMVAGAAALMTAAARAAEEQGLSGLEWAGGIPASVGGAVCMNAGAFGGCIADRLEWVEAALPDGVKRFSVRECGFAYRCSAFQGAEAMVVRAVFRLDADARERIRERSDMHRARRLMTQPAGLSAGSVFKAAADGRPAGLLIDGAGLKGTRVGGAFVSEKHANFILNDGTAGFADVMTLIGIIKEKVFSLFGTELETEIKIIN